MRISLFIPLFFLFAPIGMSAQSDGMAKKGLLRSQGGFAIGAMPGAGSNVYLDGTLAYYFDDQVSFRGDSFFLLPGASKTDLEENSSIFSGFVYHFRKNVNFDPYIGFQPGITLSKLGGGAPDGFPSNSGQKREQTFNPLVSGVAGVHYYGPAVFHLLLECRYVHGKHLSEYRGSTSLNEFRFVFGLGLNLNVLDPFWKD